MVAAAFSLRHWRHYGHMVVAVKIKVLKEMNSFKATMLASWAEFDIGKPRVHGGFQTWIWIALHSDDS